MDTSLNIYLVRLDPNHERNFEDGTYTEFVVCAVSEEEARKTHPSEKYTFTDKQWVNVITEKQKKSTMYLPRNSTWVEPFEVGGLVVTLVGKAADNYSKTTVITAAFY